MIVSAPHTLATSHEFNYLRIGAMQSDQELHDGGAVGSPYATLQAAVAAAKLLTKGPTPGLAIVESPAASGHFELHATSLTGSSGHAYLNDLSDMTHHEFVESPTFDNVRSAFDSGFGKQSALAAGFAAYVDGPKVLVPNTEFDIGSLTEMNA